MNAVLDACSIIYSINGGILHLLPSIPGYTFYVGRGLLDAEILLESQKLVIDSLVESGGLTIIEDEIGLDEVETMEEKYKIGYGEIECMILADRLDLSMVTDDKKATKSAILELGEERVTNTIHIIKVLVNDGIITCHKAFEAYEKIIASGSFLPPIEAEHFC